MDREEQIIDLIRQLTELIQTHSNSLQILTTRVSCLEEKLRLLIKLKHDEHHY